MNTALPVGVSLVVRVLHVVELERQLEVEQQHDVEALQRLRPHTEPDGQQVSEDADLAVVGIEDFGALLLQEDPGLDVGLEEVLAGQVIDTDVEVLSMKLLLLVTEMTQGQPCQRCSRTMTMLRPYPMRLLLQVTEMKQGRPCRSCSRSMSHP
ncbi:hypothetical protein D1007_31243 [Hordeum vulgare]|nr:hypothetical protein D1007_31243 [Hordeum vulgare]